MAIETPKYSVIKKDGNIELREYSEYILATVLVKSSTHNSAGNNAFSTLANYIFGNNVDSSKINMTVPVMSQQKVLSKNIAMTAPVTIANSSSDNYAVSFTMPSEYTMETIPKPKSDLVKLQEIKKHRAVALLFSGYSGESKVKKKTQVLREWVKAENLTEVGAPLLARYDPPWKPGFVRRNEVILDVK